MILYPNLEAAPDWQVLTGSNIGGISPDKFGINQKPGYIEFYTVGKPYADFLAALHLPLQPNVQNLSLQFELCLDGVAAYCAQALEFDTRVSIAGWNYNFSSQINYEEVGMLQIVNAAGKWIDTGGVPGILPAHTWIPFKYTYTFDTTKHVFSLVAATINGNAYTIPSALKNVAASTLDWADSCSLQVQLDLNSGGGAFSHRMRNIQYAWS